jgi:hypothetical protein
MCVLFLQVPRGFICPLTLDIMTQPALLISSNIAVPSSYEKEAISRWLAESRWDGRPSGFCHVERLVIWPDARPMSGDAHHSCLLQREGKER